MTIKKAISCVKATSIECEQIKPKLIQRWQSYHNIWRIYHVLQILLIDISDSIYALVGHWLDLLIPLHAKDMLAHWHKIIPEECMHLERVLHDSSIM